MSKYFPFVPAVDTSLSPPVEQSTSLIPSDTIVTQVVHKVSEEVDLLPDISLSDSPLSDLLDEFVLDDEIRELPPTPAKSPAKSPYFNVPKLPATPTKSAHRAACLPPKDPKPPRPRTPKTSHYFPKVPRNPESCLPFPAIDSPCFGLVQEQLAHEPFKLLIATIFLNRTRGGVALPVLFQVLERYPTINCMAEADESEFVSLIHRLGFQNQRARKCISLAQTWQTNPPLKDKRYRRIHYPQKLDGRDVGPEESLDDEDPRSAWEVAHLPGVGAYSLDSWRIFCRDELRGLATDWQGTGATTHGFVPEWKSVLPQDKELRAYLTWLWLKEGWVWDHHTGDLTPASDKTLRAAQMGGVAHEQDGNWVLETSPVKKAANGLHAEN
ncbi:hypothetical protein N7456_007718 [Penicillium angulare]|uniref:HhH-GPD domain-containing protein n=1 Tax=Penicillium angulare TaxID=116970 RepID=A0A9W9FBM8_9EURO|nr:hypothetical protein N7456_007718 [Penicillium angulare]